MLVVSRKKKEGIRFYLDGEEVLHLLVTDIRGAKVRIAMNGKRLQIVRDELEQPPPPEPAPCPKPT